MTLSKTEEQLMTHLWKLDQAYMKDLIDCYGDPKPATTTVATLLKRMTDKGYIGYETEGRSRKYYTKVSKEDYVSGRFQGFVKSFFEDSTSQFASFFTTSTDMSKSELEELKKIIEDQLKSK